MHYIFLLNGFEITYVYSTYLINSFEIKNTAKEVERENEQEGVDECLPRKRASKQASKPTEPNF